MCPRGLLVTDARRSHLRLGSPLRAPGAYMGHGGERRVKSNHGEIEGKAKMESDTRYNLVYKSRDGQELSGCQAYQHGIWKGM